MRPLSIVVSPPCLDDDLSLGEAVEDLTVEQFIAQLRVEFFAVTVFLRAARLDECGLRAHCYDPIPNGLGDELWAVVGTNMARQTAQDEQVRQSVDHVGGVEHTVDPDQVPQLIRAHRAILPAPAVEGLLGDAHLADRIRRRQALLDKQLNLTQLCDNFFSPCRRVAVRRLRILDMSVDQISVESSKPQFDRLNATSMARPVLLFENQLQFW